MGGDRSYANLNEIYEELEHAGRRSTGGSAAR